MILYDTGVPKNEPLNRGTVERGRKKEIIIFPKEE
jgi:hypothetical protein